MRMVRVYEDFAVNTAAIPVIAGRKSRIESFAGEQEIGAGWGVGESLGGSEQGVPSVPPFHSSIKAAAPLPPPSSLLLLNHDHAIRAVPPPSSSGASSTLIKCSALSPPSAPHPLCPLLQALTVRTPSRR